MPVFEIISPQGEKYRITAPEGATEQDALAHLQQQLGATSTAAPVGQAPTAGPDMAGGLNAGVPIDLIQPFLEKVGRFIENVKKNPPPSAQIVTDLPREFVEESKKVTRGETPDIPTLASGAAVGLPLSPAVRLGGKAAAEALTAGRPARPEAAKPITAERLAEARTADYKAAANAGLEVQAPVMHDHYNATLQKLLEAEPDLQSRAPSTWKILTDAVERTAPTKQPNPLSPEPRLPDTKPVTGNQIKLDIERLGDVRATPEKGGTDAHFARLAKQELDTRVQGLKPEQTVGGDLPTFQTALKDARGNNAAMERMKVLEAAEERVIEDKLTPKQAFKPLARRPATGRPSILQKEGFTPPEIATVRKVGSPGPVRALIEGLANTAPGGHSWIQNALTLPLHVGAAIASGGATVPLTIAGLAARPVAGVLANRAIGNAATVTGARSPLARQEAAAFAARIRAYENALSDLRAARSGGGGILPLALSGPARLFRPLPPPARP